MRQRGVDRSRRLTFATLDAIPGLAHAFCLRSSSTEAVLRAVMPAATPLRLLRQVHGATVRVAGWREATGAPEGMPPEGDALITDREAVAIGVSVADCVPILVCDPVRRGIAAVHAGWRGTVAGVLTATLEALIDRFRARPADLRLAMGPAIGACCFEVGADVINALLRRDRGAASCIRENGRRRFVDLIEANRRQALAVGVPSSHIRSANLCTVCHPDLFPSYRREPAAPGRMLAFIGWAS